MKKVLLTSAAALAVFTVAPVLQMVKTQLQLTNCFKRNMFLNVILLKKLTVK